mgnify:CR=1 FL=1
MLGALLFRKDDVFKKTTVLSGGERNRLALAKMLMKEANTIILDEPTNHLDIKSKEILQDAIREFDGTLILVSHDRDFLDPIVNKVLEVSKTGTRMLTCNVSEYLERLKKEQGKLARLVSSIGMVRPIGLFQPLKRITCTRFQSLQDLRDNSQAT